MNTSCCISLETTEQIIELLKKLKKEKLDEKLLKEIRSSLIKMNKVLETSNY